jgi:hypothetical protein
MPWWSGIGLPDKAYRHEAAVAAAPTVVTAVTTHLTKIRVVNTTAGAITFTMTNNEGSPVDKYTAVPIAANSILHEHFEVPEKMTSGIKLSASGAGLLISLAGWQKP